MTSQTPLVSTEENPLGFMARTSSSLRAVVAAQQQALPSAEFAGMVASIRGAFEKFTARLLQFEPGPARAVALHEMMERELKAAATVPISCRRGCSGCCHFEVEVTQDESALLHDIVRGGHPLDHERLALQAARERQSPEWLRFGARENRCVFLGEDAACSIYADRPAVCRKLTVTSPASACTTKGAEVLPVQVLLAEVLLSASLSLPGTETGSLSRMLLQAMQTVPVG